MTMTRAVADGGPCPPAAALAETASEGSGRAQTPAEERLNALLHGIGALGALVAGLTLLTHVAHQGHAIEVLGVGIFALTMVALYTVSTIYHALTPGPAKDRFQRIDRAAIAAFLAGTYTPIALFMVRGRIGVLLLIAEWLLAAFGIALLTGDPRRYARRSQSLYQIMGWLTALGAPGFFRHTPAAVIGALGLGALCYVGGVVLLIRDYRKYFHAAFHLLVLLGTGLQFWAISLYLG